MIKTKRLILRPWKQEDFAPYAEMNADPLVREFFPTLLTAEESNTQAALFQKKIIEKGWGLWAVEAPGEANFIGFIGIEKVPFEAHFTPNVEIGWRLAQKFWGKGYATEGALAALNYGFETLHLPEIVSLTSIHNKRSMNVMEKIGMHRNPADDFDHPLAPAGHPLQRHVLYRLSR